MLKAKPNTEFGDVRRLTARLLVNSTNQELESPGHYTSTLSQGEAKSEIFDT
jgi:hypothetical protein